MVINTTTIDVRYAETDQMGVVHHSNYLVWFEIGRTNYMKQVGLNYAQMEAESIVSPVIDLQVSYKQPATYGETVTIETRLQQYDGVRTTYEYQVFNEKKELLVSGSTVHVIVKQTNFKPTLLRNVNPDWHQVYLDLVNGEG